MSDDRYDKQWMSGLHSLSATYKEAGERLAAFIEPPKIPEWAFRSPEQVAAEITEICDHHEQISHLLKNAVMLLRPPTA